MRSFIMAQSSEKDSLPLPSKQMLMHTDRSTPLGSLGRLPPEIRGMIYNKCRYSKQILRLNTTIYSEYLQSLQRVDTFGVLRLHIDPAKHPSSVQVLTEYGRPHGSINAASSHLQFDTNPMRNMPVGRYGRIQLDIDAPNPKDPGQAIRLCKQVSAVTTSLSACWFPSTTSGIPSRVTDCLFPIQMKLSTPLKTESSTVIKRLNVTFKEDSTRSWITDRKWNKSLADYDEGWNEKRLKTTKEGSTDIDLVLQLLQKLRRVPVQLYYKHHLRRKRHLSFLEHDISELSQVTTDFGLNWLRGVAEHDDDCDCERCAMDCPWVYFSDSDILTKIHSLQVWHEFLLDDLPGRSANLLRQERFQNWCGAYERQHGQALYGVPPRLMSEFDIPKESGLPTAGAHEHLEFELWEEIETSFHSRFWAMWSCHLNKPAGVERKSMNKLWTNFPERPLVLVHPLIGFYVSIDAGWRMRRQWRDATTDCIVCRAEEDRNRRVFARKSVQGRLEVLSSSSGLGYY